jgi:hypothetical protein
VRSPEKLVATGAGNTAEEALEEAIARAEKALAKLAAAG